MIIELKLAELAIGHYVIDIASQTGTFNLTTAKHIKSAGVINNLKDKGVLSVLIDTDKTLVDKQTPKSLNEMANDLKHAKRVFDQSKEIQRKVFDDASNDCVLDLAPVVDITNQAVDAVFNSPDSIACILNIREKDEYLLEHSVSVSVYIALFAKHLGLNKKIIKHLSIGAFLHDVGKIKVPDEILNKPGKLSDEEFEIMKSHASHSIDIIKKTPKISKLSLEVAAQHHEKLNGFGYPRQLKADHISKYGRMIAICDIFDALTANRVYKEGFTQMKAFTILRELAKDNHLDSEYVEEFIRCIGLYPIGSLVKLKSNKVAIVDKRNPKDPTKPVVRSFYNVKHQHYVETKNIDLSKSDDSIEMQVRADDLNLDMNKIAEILLMLG